MNIFNLDKKIAIVTGGYGHLGKAMCKGLADMGATVIVAARDEAKYKAAFSEAERTKIKFSELDISSEASIQNCFSHVQKIYGSIDILVNNAITLKSGKPGDVSREDWNYSLDGVLASLNSCIRYVTPYMEKKNGKIINISSMYGLVSPDFLIYEEHPEYFNSAQYGASKAAVIQLTRYYANYLAPKNIRVNCITPGPFPSEQVQRSETFIKKLENKVPLKRIGQPADLTGALLLLASDASSYITGQNIIVDGGWTIV
jgi:NAD(P)-dependent dehydrogenase (short-subunit alcohol dehydrogenase family)